MAHALNLTLKIKQDPATLQRLANIKAIFADQLQPKINDALRTSKIVHFARVLVIDDKYLQVITEFDGSQADYTEFFRRKLPDVFAALFSLAENPPTPDMLTNPDKFFEFSKGLQVRALGNSVNGEGADQGYLFSAYDNREVREILPKLQ
jgi:hypothetical protein